MTGQYPKCFSALRFYESWRAANREKDATVCDDCLPSFQLAMKRVGRCSNPGAVFKFSPDGSISGLGAREDRPDPAERRPDKVRGIRCAAPRPGLRVGKADVPPKPDFWAERQKKIAELLGR